MGPLPGQRALHLTTARGGGNPPAAGAAATAGASVGLGDRDVHLHVFLPDAAGHATDRRGVGGVEARGRGGCSARRGSTCWTRRTRPSRGRPRRARPRHGWPRAPRGRRRRLATAAAATARQRAGPGAALRLRLPRLGLARRPEIAGDVAAGHSGRVRRGDQRVGVVLADARARPPAPRPPWSCCGLARACRRSRPRRRPTARAPGRAGCQRPPRRRSASSASARSARVAAWSSADRPAAAPLSRWPRRTPAMSAVSTVPRDRDHHLLDRAEHRSSSRSSRRRRRGSPRRAPRPRARLSASRATVCPSMHDGVRRWLCTTPRIGEPKR